MFETAEVEFGLPLDLLESVEDVLASLPIAAVRERLAGFIDGRDDAGGGDGDNGDNSDDGDGGDPSAGSLRDRLPSSVDDLKSGSPPSVRVAVVAVPLLILAFGSIAVFGPTLDGLGGSSGGGSGGDHGVSVLALSSVSADSADVVARWNVRTTDTLRVGNQAYAPPEGERLIVVGFNTTVIGDSSESLSQSAPVFEPDGARHGHQPLSNATGSDNGGLFAPGDGTHVRTVPIVPTNATTGTVLVQPTNEDTVTLVHDDAASTNPNGDD